MTKTFALLLTLGAATLSAQTVRVRCDSGSVTIVGGDVAAVPSAEIIATDGMTITVPRTASVEWHSRRANLTARNIGGNVIVTTGNGNIRLDGVGGLVEVTSGNGNTRVSNVRGGVFATTVNGKTEISSIGGGVTVRDTSGRTTVANVAGDVDLFTALGQARYDGPLHPARSYHLRTLDGAVTLAYAAGSGFSAHLTSDATRIEVDGKPQEKRRVVDLRAGDERARVVLDAVGGRVTLMRR
jgi:hypothetical protein